jgi:hypothetical protein
MATSERRAVERPDSPDRRRASWREFRQAYPGVVATAAFALLVLLVGDAVLLARRARYEREYARLRAGLTDVQRQRADAALAPFSCLLHTAWPHRPAAPSNGPTPPTGAAPPGASSATRTPA